MESIDVSALVIDSLNEILSMMEEKDRPQIESLDESTRLIGRKAVLDSLGLVSLIVDIEQKISDDYGISLIIAGERAMSQEKSPFRTVGTLAEYVSLLIKEQTAPAASEANPA
jgi:acyl carrier protein